jgi:hemerythrin
MNINPCEITEVCIPFMQETHLEEIDMLNALYILFDRIRQGEDVPELVDKIQSIAAHTHAHFERENTKMRELNFPPYAVHKQVHDEYLNTMDHVIAAWLESKDITPLINFFENETPEWMKQHISTMDFVTANFFAMVDKS